MEMYKVNTFSVVSLVGSLMPLQDWLTVILLISAIGLNIKKFFDNKNNKDD